VFKKIRNILRRPKRNRAAYKKYKETARALVKSRIAYYNARYQCTVNRIAIKNSKTRWGSASKKGNLNFHYKIALLEPLLADYVIVHELCHLKEFNHSKQFWQLVALAVPNHKEVRKKLKNLSLWS